MDKIPWGTEVDKSGKVEEHMELGTSSMTTFAKANLNTHFGTHLVESNTLGVVTTMIRV